MENIFEHPTKYIQSLRNIQLLNIKNNIEFSGKSIAVIFPTKYCNADCKFCIFKSPMKQNNKDTRKDELNEIGIQKSIEFINKSNIGYLLISGGGEPFLRLNEIIELISKVKVDEIVIVSNGFWAKNYEKAYEIIKKIKEIQIVNPKKITIRISADKWHSDHLGIEHLKNILNIFLNNYRDDKNLKLKIHTIINDNTIFDVLNKSKIKYNIKYEKKYSSDNEKINKSNRNRRFIELNNSYELEVEFAKLFNPDLEVDLNTDIDEQNKVFMEDLVKSQIGSFSTVVNNDKTKGLDYIISYNGNVSTWANYQINNSPNLYRDSYKEILNKIFNDIISYSFLKEPVNNIINIIEKVNPIAVKRAIGINIRDYFGMYLLYENKTLLYYYVILLKKYKAANILVNIDFIPKQIMEIVKLSEDEIVKLYNSSEYCIVNQYKEKEFIKEEWEDLFYLIIKNHFILNKAQIHEAIDYYNKNTNQEYSKIDDIVNINDSIRYKRLYKKFNI